MARPRGRARVHACNGTGACMHGRAHPDTREHSASLTCLCCKKRPLQTRCTQEARRGKTSVLRTSPSLLSTRPFARGAHASIFFNAAAPQRHTHTHSDTPASARRCDVLVRGRHEQRRCTCQRPRHAPPTLPPASLRPAPPHTCGRGSGGRARRSTPPLPSPHRWWRRTRTTP